MTADTPTVAEDTAELAATLERIGCTEVRPVAGSGWPTCHAAAVSPGSGTAVRIVVSVADDLGSLIVLVPLCAGSALEPAAVLAYTRESPLPFTILPDGNDLLIRVAVPYGEGALSENALIEAVSAAAFAVDIVAEELGTTFISSDRLPAVVAA